MNRSVKIYKFATTSLQLLVCIIGLLLTFNALWFSVTKVEMWGCGNDTIGASCYGPHWGVFEFNSYTFTVILLVLSSYRLADTLAENAGVRGARPLLFRFGLTLLCSMTAFWIARSLTMDFFGRPSLQSHLAACLFAGSVEVLRATTDQTRFSADGNVARLSFRKGKIEKIGVLTVAILIGIYFVWDYSPIGNFYESWFPPDLVIQTTDF
jgi:hypothetical protein